MSGSRCTAVLPITRPFMFQKRPRLARQCQNKRNWQTTLKPRQDITVNKLCFEYAHDIRHENGALQKGRKNIKTPTLHFSVDGNNLKTKLFVNDDVSGPARVFLKHKSKITSSVVQMKNKLMHFRSFRSLG